MNQELLEAALRIGAEELENAKAKEHLEKKSIEEVDNEANMVTFKFKGKNESKLVVDKENREVESDDDEELSAGDILTPSDSSEEDESVVDENED